ncbi:MAG TPA: hypothetical protein VF595_14725 [Tepidisphaeraceae bacterium]|jgi:hypothetical protein
MADLTDKQLDDLVGGALGQLATAVNDYKTAKAEIGKKPNEQQAVQWFAIAKESLRTSLLVYNNTAAQAAARVQKLT